MFKTIMAAYMESMESMDSYKAEYDVNKAMYGDEEDWEDEEYEED